MEYTIHHSIFKNIETPGKRNLLITKKNTANKFLQKMIRKL